MKVGGSEVQGCLQLRRDSKARLEYLRRSQTPKEKKSLWQMVFLLHLFGLVIYFSKDLILKHLGSASPARIVYWS